MDCPSGEELLAFHLGELAEAQILTLGDHLSACADCEQQARKLDSLSDTALSALRRSGESGVTQSTSRPPATLEIPGYEMLGLLGKGGMGVVYKARHRHLNRLVAVKCLRADSAPQLERFQAEAQAFARLQHPNIIQIYEVGEWNGQPFLALEFLDGGTLDDQLSGRPQDARASAALVRTLAQAVHHAHAQGIVHRDLKPANVLMSGEGPVAGDEQAAAVPASLGTVPSSPIPKITDFGIAKHLRAAGQTREGEIVGTARYMAPEQAAGKGADIGPASDIYSLGVILYEMLTGRVPLQGANDLETVQLVQDVEPVPPRRLQPGLPRDLETICLKCLRKEPVARYATAEELALDLGRQLAGEPIAARPTPAWERAWKWTKRRPARAAVIALAAFIVCVGFPSTTYLWMQADYARAEEWEHRLAAEAEKRRADSERAVAQAVNDFLLKDLLGQAYIGNQPFGTDLPERNPKITVRELLDRADKAVVGKFADQPLVEAAVRQTVADTYGALTEFALGIPHAERALTLRRTELGPDHRDTLTTRNNLAMMTLGAGNGSEAVVLLEQVWQARRQLLGPDDPETLRTLQHLGVAYMAIGKAAQAVAHLEQARDAQMKNPGLNHPDTLKTMSFLATAYTADRRPNEAILLLEQLREPLAKAYGADHHLHLLSLGNLGIAYLSAGKYQKAIAVLENVYGAYEKKNSIGHLHGMAILANLAMAYQAEGNLKRALPLFRQAALDLEKRHFRHESAGHVIGNLSRCHELLGEYTQAEIWRRKWLAAVQEKHGPNSGPSGGALMELGMNLLKQQKHADAEPILRESLTIVQEKQPQAWTTFMARSLLGGALSGQKKFSQAEPLLLAGYEGMKQREERISPQSKVRVIEALERLVQHYDACDLKDKADAWRQKLNR